MPYTQLYDREVFADVIETIKYIFSTKKYSEENSIENLSCGDLNYLLTSLCHAYLNEKGEKYQIYNDIIGVLECAKQELYRRKIAEYENKKIKENGDLE